jgi:hypothetical protein
MPLGFRFGRPASPLSRVILSRTARHHSLQLDYLLPLFDNQALQFGLGQAIKIIGR